MRTDIRTGVRYLVDHRLLRLLAVCVGVSNLASTATIAILPLHVIDPGPIGLDGTGYGLLITTIAAGSVLGTLIVERLHARFGTRRLLLASTLGFPLFSLAPIATDSVALIGIGLFLAGAISVGWNIVTVSIRQRIVPDHLLGRVNSGYRLVAWGTMPIGAALGGILAGTFGVPAALLTAAAISSVCTPIVYFGVTPGLLGSSGAGRPQPSRGPTGNAGDADPIDR